LPRHKNQNIFLHPNYHGYTLDDAACERLLQAASDRGLIVQLALIMEDERTLHPLVRVPAVDARPLAGIVAKLPQLKLVLVNCFRTLRIDQSRALADTGQVYFEVSMLEGVGGIAKLLEAVPRERVLFGSYYPFFYLESALLKLRESPLDDATLRAITQANAARLLA
jgi:hypothetical protein